jgi:hypothetical protein
VSRKGGSHENGLWCLVEGAKLFCVVEVAKS